MHNSKIFLYSHKLFSFFIETCRQINVFLQGTKRKIQQSNEQIIKSKRKQKRHKKAKESQKKIKNHKKVKESQKRVNAAKKLYERKKVIRISKDFKKPSEV